MINDESVEMVATAIPDEKKGERVILLVATNDSDFQVSSLKKLLIDSKCKPLLIPSESREIEQVPKLGSGKTDFASAKQLVLDLN